MMEHNPAVDIDIPEPDWLVALEADDEVDGRIGFSGGEFPDGGDKVGVVAALAVSEFRGRASGSWDGGGEGGEWCRCRG